MKRKSSDQSIELRKYLSFNLIVLLTGFKGRFMFRFHVDLDIDIFFETLTAQIGARLGLGTQLHFEARLPR